MCPGVTVEAKKDITIEDIMKRRKAVARENKYIELTATLDNGVPVIELQEV